MAHPRGYASFFSKHLPFADVQNVVLEGMCKAYGGVPALDNVTMTLHAGRVHALMGENGAGKSTLIKLAAGVVPADKMRLIKDGTTLPLSNPQDAHSAGFRFIHQELNIVPQVSVAENILLGRSLPQRFGVAVDWAAVHGKAQQALKSLGANHIDVTDRAGDLSTGDKMLIRIAAALVVEDRAQADVYVFDEPTAALTDAESDRLFSVIDRLTQQGAAVLYVSHRLDEVFRICDDITVLRDGKHISTSITRYTSKEQIIRAMTGREVKDAFPLRDSDIGAEVVVSVKAAETASLSGLTFDLFAGEILGVSGLAEAGQTQLLRLFMGLEPLTSGIATFNGQAVPTSPSTAWAHKVAYVPRERRSEALMLSMPISANALLPHLGMFGLTASKSNEIQQTRVLGEQVKLKYASPDQAVCELSGGNQQKVVFARAVCGNPRLLLLDEPTQGVDVGAKHDIYLLVRELTAQGCSVILTSTDLPEIIGMCDRILVLHEGRQTHLLERGDMSTADLLSHLHAGEDFDRSFS